MIEILSQIWPSLVTAFCVSALVSRLLALLLEILGKSAPTRTGSKMPLTGGIGIFLGFFFALPVFLYTFKYHFNEEFADLFFLLGVFCLLAAVFPYFILGLLDDIFHFRPEAKLFGFIIVTVVQLLFCAFYFHIEWFTFLLLLPAIGLFFFSNSYNFLDNADGHCATAFLGLIFALFFLSKHPGSWAYCGLVLAAAVLGFLIWNFPVKPRLYLGDAGSLFLGACAPVLVLFSVLFMNEKDDLLHILIKIFASVTLLAFPLYDTCAVMLLRIRRGQNPTIGGQDHYSHRLMRAGFPLWAVNLWTFIAAGILPAAIFALPRRYVFAGPIVIWLALFCVDFFAYYSVDRPLKTD